MLPPNNSVHYPDTIAVSVDDHGKKVTCVYNDHSLYQWSVEDIKKVGKSRSFLFHSGSIWGLEVGAIVFFLLNLITLQIRS